MTDIQSLMGESLKSKQSNTSSCPTRIFLCSTISSSATAESVSSALNSTKQEIEEGKEGDSLTSVTGGAIITSNAAVISFFEVSDSEVCKLLTTLNASKTLQNTIVLCASQNCLSRNFANFGVYSSNPAPSDVDISSEGANAVAMELTELILSASDELVEGGSNIVALQKTTALPSSNAITACCKSKDFASLDEYVELFGGQVQVELASEKAWPLQPVVIYK